MRVLLPNEPSLSQVVTERRLTDQFLVPALKELEHCFLEVRRWLDVELSAIQPIKLGKPYPLGQCLEIAQAFERRIQGIDPSKLSGTSVVGYRAFKSFLKAGGSFRQVWGDLRGQYFQNAFQLGSLYVDVSNDTVVPTKPKVEILPFETANFKAIRSYEQFATIARSYWEVDLYPNHVLYAIAPHCPVIGIRKSGQIVLYEATQYMLAMTRSEAFIPSEKFLAAEPMPANVFDAVRNSMIGMGYELPSNPQVGRKMALANCRLYRKKRWHQSREKLREVVPEVKKINRHLTQFKLISASEDFNVPTIKINDKDYDTDSLSAEAKSQLDMLLATEVEISRLQTQLVIAQTAKNAYARALAEAVK